MFGGPSEEELNALKNSFSPKRFKRFPRFTIFLNKDENSEYERANTISLNPQFMNFLLSPERAELASMEFNEALRLIN